MALQERVIEDGVVNLRSGSLSTDKCVKTAESGQGEELLQRHWRPAAYSQDGFTRLR